MKTFKLILKISISVIFVLSIALNIILFNSSYGSLIFKYNENKFLSMNEIALSKVDLSTLTARKDFGMQVEYTNFDKCENVKAMYYVDKDSTVSFSAKCTYSKTEDGIVKHYVDEIYFQNDTLYTNINGQKAKKQATYPNALNEYTNILNFANDINLTGEIIAYEKEKTGSSISFSPLYVLGIKYKYTNDANTTYKYGYDLDGDLRKVEINGTKDNKTFKKSFKINYKLKKISFPGDLNEYQEAL